MYIESIKMRVEEIPGGARHVGEGAPAAGEEESEGRGYSPMSNVRGARGARNVHKEHPPFSPPLSPRSVDVLSPQTPNSVDTLSSQSSETDTLSSQKKNPEKKSEQENILSPASALRSPTIPVSKSGMKTTTAYELLTPPKKLLTRSDRPTPITAKKFFAPKTFTDEYAFGIAEAMVAYFSRPLSGWYKEIILNRDGSQSEVEKPYVAPVPLLAEFANMVALTESEVKQLARAYPQTVGRALEFAQDVLKTNVVRGGLTGDYHPQFATFTLTNETTMRSKTEATVRTIDMNALLDDIENSNAPLVD